MTALLWTLAAAGWSGAYALEAPTARMRVVAVVAFCAAVVGVIATLAA
jgi:hypothetical protein